MKVVSETAESSSLLHIESNELFIRNKAPTCVRFTLLTGNCASRCPLAESNVSLGGDQNKSSSSSSIALCVLAAAILSTFALDEHHHHRCSKLRCLDFSTKQNERMKLKCKKHRHSARSY